MADGDLLSLLLKVEGGEASAAEVEKVRAALRGVETENDALKERFQEGFQHIALKGFLTDASRSIGVGGELRPIIRLLNVGVSELAETMGVAGSSVALLGAGFTALAAIGFVIYEHFKKHNENLDEMIKKQAEARDTTDALRDALNKYDKEIQGLPDHLKKLQQAVVELDEVQTRSLINTEKKKLEEARTTVEKNNEKIESLKKLNEENERGVAYLERTGQATLGLTAAIDANKKKLDELTESVRGANAQIKISEANIAAQMHGAKDATEQTNKLAEAHKKGAEALKKATEDSQKFLDKLSSEIGKETDHELGELKKVEDARIKLGEKTRILADEEAAITSDSIKKKSAEIQKFHDQQIFSINEEYRKGIEAARGNANATIQIEKAKNDAIIQLDKTTTAKKKENLDNVQQTAVDAANAIESGVGGSLAKTIVEGKNFQNEMDKVFKDVAEQAIQQLIRVELQAIITKEAVAAVFGGV